MKRVIRQSCPQGVVTPLEPSIRDSRRGVRVSAATTTGDSKHGQLEIRDSHRAKLVRYGVESVGFKVTGEAVYQRGNRVLIPCNANAAVEDRLLKRLKVSLGNRTKLHRIGDRLWIEFLDRSGRVGRPQETEDRKLAEKLRADGLTYPMIAKKMAEDTGTLRTPGAYRKMLANSKPSS